MKEELKGVVQERGSKRHTPEEVDDFDSDEEVENAVVAKKKEEVRRARSNAVERNLRLTSASQSASDPVSCQRRCSR